MTISFSASAASRPAIAASARRTKLFHRTKSTLVTCVALLTLTFGCRSTTVDEREKRDVLAQEHALQGLSERRKSIFVFLDGTSNGPNSNTNVWRLYQFVTQNKDRQMTAIYIAGVGTTETSPVLIDAALGHGMEQRILRAYQFIASNYKLGDEIYIFGFSRGAHQARSLAGLISYAGIPAGQDKDSDHLIKIGNNIIELVKKKSDADYLDEWASWHPGQSPILAPQIKDELGFEMYSAEVRFLGVWDTVPGSSLKGYGVCKEKKGFIKKSFYWLLPGIDKGERYKTDSYPAIRQIAHAVSLDENRSRFSPLLVCEALNSEYTKISESWFPGAHADVGGGYEDSDELPSISLGWMIGLLAKSYKLDPSPQVYANPGGLAHWPMGDRFGNVGSKCIDRQPPEDATVHESVHEREALSPVPIRFEGEVRRLKYPTGCGAM